MAFTIPLGQLTEKIKADIDTMVRKATFTVFSKVVLKSPVDTGRFRANWNASFGAPNYTTTESTNQQRGADEAARAATLPLGGIVYFANSLPYAQRLENGYSQQAPAGMVRLSAIEFGNAVQQALQRK
jgi:hypothetical protein